MKRIEKIHLTKKSFPLKHPYVLSFETLNEFEVFHFQVTTDDGENQVGEVTPLYGYSDETPEQIYQYLQQKSTDLIGLTLKEARNIVAKDISNLPFSSSAILTAIDLLINPLNLNIDLDKYQYVTPTSTSNIGKLLEVYRTTCIDNDETVKVKLLGDLQQDVKAISELDKIIIKQAPHIRLDANQAYGIEDGLEFFKFINQIDHVSSIQYVEQPYPVGAWEHNKKTLKHYNKVPIMLDESIISKSDIDKAKSLGINHIKLKLYKQGGILELIDCSKYASENKMAVILGNGVAGTLTNQIEVAVFNQNKSLFDPILEANGFKKLV